MGKEASDYNHSDPQVLRGKLELYQFAHGLQQRYNVPLSPVDTALSADKIMAALYESLTIKQPTPPAGKDAIAYWEGHLEAALEARGTGNGDGGGVHPVDRGVAMRRDSYGGLRPDYISGGEYDPKGRRMRTDSTTADNAAARRSAYAAKIEARSGGRSRRQNSATGGEEFRTDSADSLQWVDVGGGVKTLNLNTLHPGVPAPPATPRNDSSAEDETPPTATNSRQSAASVARIEAGGRSGKRRKKAPPVQ